MNFKDQDKDPVKCTCVVCGETFIKGHEGDNEKMHLRCEILNKNYDYSVGTNMNIQQVTCYGFTKKGLANLKRFLRIKCGKKYWETLHYDTDGKVESHYIDDINIKEPYFLGETLFNAYISIPIGHGFYGEHELSFEKSDLKLQVIPNED